MKTVEFQDLLFNSAFAIIACDGNIDEIEINELKDIAENEIYFMGYDYEKSLNDNLKNIKARSINVIKDFLDGFDSIDINEKQKQILIEVLIRVIDSDEKVNPNELKFLQIVISKLKINQESLILNFPNKTDYFVNNEKILLNTDFPDSIKIIK